ncbi:Guanosine-3',5'-bis(diphosphate) 3'-pyrophosphohydrolase MESH1 [Lucilia cuprina]|uniref:Guanosine-3',5'-bis(diphosphate) 3'-pyrophosphohydrolase MESH1 n=1 Tax=Lucilia cuprina TaxID=7375 RepID=A0A0L0CEI1_LUCCU|nr:guanosine-3',5'-bis(diphosphate) 3'-pyrophosphohydrolase MESH1 [Lucilia cuprina]XP_046805695.1 guanosine-3',5'-bis(diphosphate) 3'-pyrophosphohydrolase MESH1 [Lucilia cuprina]KAI8123077.1 5'-bis(diphosphate) 3'-pyrophosphohydrolase MESH1, Guanosine-3' [Lucilia cuprina]KNC30661.1 Guanosine-3',5'-bis(diphosphate) 3'-pyrophosphohydrolase MESH1 [Lucilia cuprina]
MPPSNKFMECLQFAAFKHRDQRRKNANQTPYINHPINVATILSVEGKIDDESILMAALLHDTVEDTDTTFGEIEELFGTEICNIVREVTDDKTLEKQVRKQLQIEHAANASTKAKLVKLADKLDNLRDLEQILPNGWTEQRREEYFIWAKKVVDNLRGTNKEIENELDEIFKKRQLL